VQQSINGERDFQLRMCQKPFVGWAPHRSTVKAHSAHPDLAEFVERTSGPGTGNGHKVKAEKGESKERGRKKGEAAILALVLPVPALTIPYNQIPWTAKIYLH